MILISHRGNTNGKQPSAENRPDYIDEAIGFGFDVEIDIRCIGDDLYLGHDTPDYLIPFSWLEERKDKLWIHCKDVESVQFFTMKDDFNYFWHEKDTLTLTSKSFIWAYPGKQPIKYSIAVLPEIFNDDLSICIGICSDVIENYKNG